MAAPQKEGIFWTERDKGSHHEDAGRSDGRAGVNSRQSWDQQVSHAGSCSGLSRSNKSTFAEGNSEQRWRHKRLTCAGQLQACWEHEVSRMAIGATEQTYIQTVSTISGHKDLVKASSGGRFVDSFWCFAVLSASCKLSRKNSHLNQAPNNHNFGNCQRLVDVRVSGSGEMIREGELQLAPRFRSRGHLKEQQFLT